MKRDIQPCVYIMASGYRGTLYTGATSDLPSRVWQHREGMLEGFTKRHGIKRLVHFEVFDTMESAIAREKQIKTWRRQWKINLIEERNASWRDLAADLEFEPIGQPSAGDGS